MTRKLDFSDSFTSSAAPDVGQIEASALQQYANDAAYEADNGVGSAGDMYYNTTDNQVKFHNGTSWNHFVDTVSVQAAIGGDKTFSDNVVVTGDLTVNGTTTSVQTTNTVIKDANIVVNNGGNDASSEGAGITVERTGTDGSIVYEDALTSKFKVGALGGELEVADVSSAQTISGKTLNTTDLDGGTASNTSRITIPKDTKANLDALTRKEGTIVYATDDEVLYSDDGTTLNELGGGGGSGFGGINFLTGDDISAETSLGTWAKYSGGGVEPVDGTGGAPSTFDFLHETGADVLLGVGSFNYEKLSANNQGEGVSVDFVIPNAFLGRRIQVSFEFKATSGFVIGDNGSLTLYAYNVDSAILQKLDGSDFQSASGTFTGFFQAHETDVNWRLILHPGNSGLPALYDLFFDNVAIGPQTKTLGLAGSNWQSFDMTIDATTSTPTKSTSPNIDQASWRRVGDSMEITYTYNPDTTTGSAAGTGDYLFKLPAGYSIDSSKIAIGVATAEDGVCGVGTLSAGPSAMRPVKMFAYNTTSLGMMGPDVSSGALQQTTSVAGSGFFSLVTGSLSYSFTATVPITGWNAEVGLVNASSSLVSSAILNGTRITNTDEPAALGEYKVYRKDTSSNAGTVDATALGTAITAADGMKIFGAVNFATQGTAGDPNRWEIFCGKGKIVTPVFYKDTGRTGNVSIDCFEPSSTAFRGTRFSYDPTTGIAIVDCMDQAGTTTDRKAGRTLLDDGAVGSADDIYFDIRVSENVGALLVDDTVNVVNVNTGNGHGSTNNKIRRFTNIVRNEGGAITYTDSATDGAEFTINQNGVYSMMFVNVTTSTPDASITLNSTELTTDFFSVIDADILTSASDAAGGLQAMTVSYPLVRGDVIRAHTRGFADSGGNNDQVRFVITKIA